MTAFVRNVGGYQQARDLLWFSKSVIETNLATQRVFSTTSTLVLANSGVLTGGQQVIKDYPSKVVEVILGSIQAIASKAVEIEAAVKSYGLNEVIAGLSATSKLTLRVGGEQKAFSVQESLNLIDSNLQPLQGAWQDYTLEEAGPQFVLQNLENAVQLGLIALSSQVTAYIGRLQSTASDEAFAFMCATAGVGLTVLLAAGWMVAKNWEAIRKEINYSYGFSLDDCSNLREGLEQIRKILTLASDRMGTSPDSSSHQSVRILEDEAKPAAGNQNADKAGLEIKRRKRKGSLLQRTLVNIALNSVFVLLVLGASCGLVYRFASNYGLLVDQNAAFNAIVRVALEQSSRLNLAKVFVLNKLRGTSLPFKEQAAEHLIRQYALEQHGQPLVDLARILQESQSFYIAIDGDSKFFYDLTAEDVCLLYDQNKARYRDLFLKQPSSEGETWFTQDCSQIVGRITGDRGLNKGIASLVSSLNNYATRLQEAIYLVLNQGISPPLESSCPDSDFSVITNRAQKVGCLLSTSSFWSAGTQRSPRLYPKHRAASPLGPLARQVGGPHLRSDGEHHGARQRAAGGRPGRHAAPARPIAGLGHHASPLAAVGPPSLLGFSSRCPAEE